MPRNILLLFKLHAAKIMHDVSFCRVSSAHPTAHARGTGADRRQEASARPEPQSGLPGWLGPGPPPAAAAAWLAPRPPPTAGPPIGLRRHLADPPAGRPAMMVAAPPGRAAGAGGPGLETFRQTPVIEESCAHKYRNSLVKCQQSRNHLSGMDNEGVLCQTPVRRESFVAGFGGGLPNSHS